MDMSMKFPVAVQMFSVRDAAEKDLAETLKKIKEYGYDGIELAGLYGKTPEEIKAICLDIGLTPISAHIGYYDLMADADGVLAQYEKIGCKYVVVPWLGEELRYGGSKHGEFMENMPMLGKKAKEHNMTLLYHNHDFEFEKIKGTDTYVLDELYASIPADLLQTEIDVCWVGSVGEDPAEYVRKYSGRSPVLHLKDFVGTKKATAAQVLSMAKNKNPDENKKFEFRPVGFGVQNFPEILKAAEEAGVSWVVVEQDEPSMELSAMECAKTSRDYLKIIGY